jgi:hypothetical protein
MTHSTTEPAAGSSQNQAMGVERLKAYMRRVLAHTKKRVNLSEHASKGTWTADHTEPTGLVFDGEKCPPSDRSDSLQ